MSDYIRRKAVRAGFPEQKLRVHYTGIDFSRFSPSANIADRDKNLVLYVGRLIPYKGADHLVRAMSIVRQTCPAAHLIVIGDGTLRPAVEGLANQLNVPTQCLGEQPPAIIRTWLDRARVFCGPSVTQPDGSSEAFGNVFTEAQAMGVPVVSYRHGGIPETMLAGETGLLAEEGNHFDLAAQLSRFLRDDALWMRAHETGMRWVRENFDVFKQTEKLESLYEEVLSSQARGGDAE
ncbi:MAG TPA: glycosyltransferase [Bryobacteraceae bacterium]|nr:glycosyltransferase [Bryobacteraceae bacterium]